MRRDSVANTFLVAGVLCIVCSVLVSVTAVALREQQRQNAEKEFSMNILECCGLASETVDIEQVFQDKIERRVVELASGQFVDSTVYSKLGIDPGSYDIKQILRTDGLYDLLDRDRDTASIKRLEKYAVVYLYREEGQLKQVILPIRGYGLWSTLYGFISLDAELENIQGITFYEHKETPGLGGEVDNLKWKQQWYGKTAFTPDGDVKVEVVRGKASDASYQVDGLAGATITTRGVSNLVKFWLGPDGFGVFLDKRPFIENPAVADG
ncbi:MAG: Na(+)-translocating NADH-quinone reductase subunit C [Planctomycetota bacterium]|nr:Na(+)-translocating NADH-quinone reductase subunit C [Planctomycetota bacterium]